VGRNGGNWLEIPTSLHRHHPAKRKRKRRKHQRPAHSREIPPQPRNEQQLTGHAKWKNH
jgi:hypothetical protein